MFLRFKNNDLPSGSTEKPVKSAAGGLGTMLWHRVPGLCLILREYAAGARDASDLWRKVPVFNAILPGVLCDQEFHTVEQLGFRKILDNVNWCKC
jgi:hypothetical protein